MQVRSYVPLDSGWARLRRSTGSVFKRTGLSVRSTEPLHTLVYYSADPLARTGRTIFRIPNSQIDPYMRTALMRAHKSTMAPAGPYRLCECGVTNCRVHPLPDLKAKFVAVFVLDPDVAISQPEHRALLREHLRREGALQKGEWDVYRLPSNETTDFVSTPAIHVFIIDCFV